VEGGKEKNGATIKCKVNDQRVKAGASKIE
jgi:hypothetical protein